MNNAVKINSMMRQAEYEFAERVAEIIRKEKERGAIIILACHDYELLSSTADEIFRLTAGKITKHLIKNEEDKFREVTR